MKAAAGRSLHTNGGPFGNSEFFNSANVKRARLGGKSGTCIYYPSPWLLAFACSYSRLSRNHHPKGLINPQTKRLTHCRRLLKASAHATHLRCNARSLSQSLHFHTQRVPFVAVMIDGQTRNSDRQCPPDHIREKFRGWHLWPQLSNQSGHANVFGYIRRAHSNRRYSITRCRHFTSLTDTELFFNLSRAT